MSAHYVWHQCLPEVRLTLNPSDYYCSQTTERDMQLVESRLFITEGQVILKCDKDSDFPYVVYVCLQKLRIIRAIRVIQIKPTSPNN